MNLHIKGAQIEDGKFHKANDKDTEVSADDINKTTIQVGSQIVICACGRADLTRGVLGGLSILDNDIKTAGNKGIRVVATWFDCPRRKSKSHFELKNIDSRYAVTKTGFNESGGAIGNVTVTVVKN